MKVLVACEKSKRVSNAFAELGHDAWSCDVLPAECEGNHIQDDILNHLEDGWDMMIAHPECTYLANSGVRWCVACGGYLTLADKQLADENTRELQEAYEFTDKELFVYPQKMRYGRR